MHPHGGKIGAQRGLHVAAHRVRQRAPTAGREAELSRVNRELASPAETLRHRCRCDERGARRPWTVRHGFRLCHRRCHTGQMRLAAGKKPLDHPSGHGLPFPDPIPAPSCRSAAPPADPLSGGGVVVIGRRELPNGNISLDSSNRVATAT